MRIASFVRYVLAGGHAVGTGLDGHCCIVRSYLQREMRTQVWTITLLGSACVVLSRWRRVPMCIGHRLLLRDHNGP